MRLLRFAVLFIAPLPLWGQALTQGIVLDAESHEPVAGVHVLGFGKQRSGSSTNSEGRFALHDTNLDSLRITCIGYTPVLLSGNALQHESLTILLKPFVTPLQALTVKPPSPQHLIREAVRAIPKNYSSPPFQVRGFYREVIRADAAYYAVAEAVFESQVLKTKGDDPALLKLVQGRRSETVKSTRIFEDYHPGGGPNYLMNHILEADLPDFLKEQHMQDYIYSIDSITSYEGKDVYLIGFDQRDNLKKNLWTGTIFLDAESFAIIQVTWSLSEKSIEYRKHLAGADKVMADLLGIDFTVLKKSTTYSYHKTGATFALQDARLTMDIHFRQPRKNIDEQFTFLAEMLALHQTPGPLTPFTKSDVWQKNRLVKSLPGEFDPDFWGAENIIQPDKSLTDAVASMDVLKASKLPTGVPDGWSLFRSSDAKAYQRDSTLMLKPFVESRWKDADRGPFLWQPVNGNTELFARLSVSKTIDTTAAPDAGFQVGGLMLRSDTDSMENHIFFALGCMGNPQLKLVSQNTINGRSAIHVTRIDHHQLTIRLRRMESLFQLHYLSPETNQWVPLREIQRKDMPQNLQAGIAGFAWVPGDAPNRHPDLLIQAHGFRITSLQP
ncbi:MAG: hypothetical protein JNL40_09905 [Cyclobacteriaceae bacterium]|nr:hypothetical protein [Cyclobacteriaceae bacterium]